MSKSANRIRLALVALFLGLFAHYAPAAGPSVNVNSSSGAYGAAGSAVYGTGIAAHGALSGAQDTSGAYAGKTTSTHGHTTSVTGTTSTYTGGATGNLVGGFGHGGAIAGGEFGGSASAASH